MATGSTTQTVFRAGKFTTAKFAWLASSGTGSMAAAVTNSAITKDIRGTYCVLAITDPGASTAPTANYDITVDDSFGCDIFGGRLANRSATVTEQAMPSFGGGQHGPRPIMSALSIAITNNAVKNASGAYYLVFTEKP